MKFKREIKEEIEQVLGPMPEHNYMKDVEIVDVKGSYFVSKKDKEYKIGKVIHNIYNFNKNEYQAIDAVIGSFMYEIGETKDMDLINEVYDGEAESCMTGEDIYTAWEELIDEVGDDRCSLLYLKEGDKYIARVVINRKDRERGAIYTNNNKIAYHLLYKLVGDYKE